MSQSFAITPPWYWRVRRFCLSPDLHYSYPAGTGTPSVATVLATPEFDPGSNWPHAEHPQQGSTAPTGNDYNGLTTEPMAHRHVNDPYSYTAPHHPPTQPTGEHLTGGQQTVNHQLRQLRLHAGPGTPQHCWVNPSPLIPSRQSSPQTQTPWQHRSPRTNHPTLLCGHMLWDFQSGHEHGSARYQPLHKLTPCRRRSQTNPAHHQTTEIDSPADKTSGRHRRPSSRLARLMLDDDA